MRGIKTNSHFNNYNQLVTLFSTEAYSGIDLSVRITVIDSKPFTRKIEGVSPRSSGVLSFDNSFDAISWLRAESKAVQS